jgi:hypothetical protein
MSEHVPEAEVTEISQEEVTLAETQEQSELNASQNAYLKRRVVILRLQNNRLQAEIEKLKEQLPEDNESDSEEEVVRIAEA